MLNTMLMDTLILFLLVYAMMDILTHLTKFCADRLLQKRVPPGHYILLLRSGTLPIEAVIRSALRAVNQKTEHIILVNAGLTQEEHEIAEKLCEDYPCLLFLEREEYIHFIRRQTQSEQNGQSMLSITAPPNTESPS